MALVFNTIITWVMRFIYLVKLSHSIYIICLRELLTKSGNLHRIHALGYNLHELLTKTDNSHMFVYCFLILCKDWKMVLIHMRQILTYNVTQHIFKVVFKKSF